MQAKYARTRVRPPHESSNSVALTHHISSAFRVTGLTVLVVALLPFALISVLIGILLYVLGATIGALIWEADHKLRKEDRE